MNLNSRKVLITGVLLAFLVNMFGPMPSAQAQEFRLPSPGVRVSLSPEYNPPILKGIKVHPDNPFRFDFILDQGDKDLRHPERSEGSQQEQLKTESTRLIKYFLASLTIPEKDLWVNLSPYEKNRIVPGSFGQTEMGRDLLAEDYMLKQITASLIYPEDEIGKKFWKRIYEEAAKKFGTTNIPVNTFNKVWIVPEKAVVYENAKAGTAYVVESKLKVMLEQDYLSLEKHADISPSLFKEGVRGSFKDSNALGSQIVREIVIPELTKEVNEGKNFAQLRQVYNSLILAIWYKKKIKDSILVQVYADKNKVAGAGYKNLPVEAIYQRYLQAFKKGAYNYIKEDIDPLTQETVPRKYFSGGFDAALIAPMLDFAKASQLPQQLDNAQIVTADLAMQTGDSAQLAQKLGDQARTGDFAMRVKNEKEIQRILKPVEFVQIAGGNNSFEGVYEDRNRNSPLAGHVIKVPKPGMTEGQLQFSKENMGGLLANFNTVSNVVINGIERPFGVIQKELKVFKDVERLTDVQGYRLPSGAEIDLVELEKNLVEAMVKRGIYYQDALIPQNYGLDEKAGKLYLIDHGDAMFIGPDHPYLNKYVFRKPIDPRNPKRKGSPQWEFYKDRSVGHYFNRIGVEDNNTLYKLWGTQSIDNRPVPDIELHVDQSQVLSKTHKLGGSVQSARQSRDRAMTALTDAEDLNYAGRYDPLLFWLDHNDIFRIQDLPPSAVVDIGCSFGYGTLDLARKLEKQNPSLKVYGVDPGDHVGKVRETEEMPPNLIFMQDDHRLTSPDRLKQPIRIMTAFNLLRYANFREKPEMIQQMAENLAEKGLLILGDGGNRKDYGLTFIVFQKRKGELVPIEMVLNRFGLINDTNHFEDWADYIPNIGQKYFYQEFRLWASEFEKIVVRGLIELQKNQDHKTSSESLHEMFFKKQLDFLKTRKVKFHSLFNGFVSIPLSQFMDRALLVNNKKEVGGIDLTPSNMNLQTQNKGSEIKFHLDSAQLAQLQNAPGFVPVIINIQPLNDLKSFLGVREMTP
jgi:SAM-dependent methyltransferase